jgi:hypothetical protein
MVTEAPPALDPVQKGPRSFPLFVERKLGPHSMQCYDNVSQDVGRNVSGSIVGISSSTNTGFITGSNSKKLVHHQIRLRIVSFGMHR